MKHLFLFILSFWALSMFAQIAPDTYYVQFTDKNNSPYSFNHPEQFLTQRAIQRRMKHEIPFQENDLPVNPDYLQGVAATGASILFPTKWFNGVTIQTTNTAVLDAINALPYVLNISKLHDQPSKQAWKEKAYFANEYYTESDQTGLKGSANSLSFDYGNGLTQINQINGIALHEAGLRGQGMVIAVLDGGFADADTHIAFDSLRANNQILGTKDFVHRGGSVYTESSHGTSVLSTMGANVPGQLIGTAPKASYWLLRSEYVLSEHLIEEFNWASAAEFADSVGADIINSSLGYIDFDWSQWNHAYPDMDGNTCKVTIAANLAASKGILVVNSAGNSGSSSSFPYIGAPADGADVFSIGAVTGEGIRAGFSSIGPTYDGRIKPDVMAMGQNTALANGNNNFTYGSGTSFSSPVMAGMSACLWQAHPYFSNFEIKDAIMMSGDKAVAPDVQYGYGIPDFVLANSFLTSIDTGTQKDVTLLKISPNPFHHVNGIWFPTQESLVIRIFDSKGVIVKELSLSNPQQGVVRDALNGLSSGFYSVDVRSENARQLIKLVKFN